MRGMLAVLAMLPVWAAPVLAQDAAEGRRLAEQWCANCHRIAPDGPGPVSDAVPSFMAIAMRPGRTMGSISTFLRTPHASMPDHGLTLRQSQDLAAYLLSQRPR
ncbi:c-type cytochrome [Falsiroseomonas sp.]|uniref:c-type cytochrome n=1 Tax=Falsiroseomonas sp. TaxID=2870721 RepID=UPI003562698E